MPTRGPFRELVNMVAAHARQHKDVPLNAAFFVEAVTKVATTSGQKRTEGDRMEFRWCRRTSGADTSEVEITVKLYPLKHHGMIDKKTSPYSLSVKSFRVETEAIVDGQAKKTETLFRFSCTVHEPARLRESSLRMFSDPRDMVSQVLALAAEKLNVKVEEERAIVPRLSRAVQWREDVTP